MAATLPAEHPSQASEFALTNDTVDAKPRRTTPEQLGDLILSTDPKMRLAVRLGLLPSGIYVAWCVMHLFAVRFGFESQTTANWLTASHIVGILAFYPLVRSGYTMRFQDSGLVLPQILYASAEAVVGYALIPSLRATILQMLCLIQVFGLFSLRPRQTVIAGASTVGMLVAMWCTMTLLQPPEFHPAAEAMKLSLSSFVVMLLALISTRYSRMRGILREQKQELTSAVEQVRQIATRDPLTGLYNRQHMQEMLPLEKKRQARTGQAFSVALIDLDHFKRINDTHGHNVGDEVLCGFAQALQTIMRETDLVCRWGGEEFLVLLPDTTANDGLAGLDRLRKHLVGLPLASSQPLLRATLSAGVATHRIHETLEQTIERADQALYAAKSDGRDRCMVAN